MHAFSGRFSRTCLEGISFNFFVCFIFNVSLGSAPKRKNFDIQRNTRVGSGGQFTSNRLSNDLIFSPNLINIADGDRGEVDLGQRCSCVLDRGHRLLLGVVLSGKLSRQIILSTLTQKLDPVGSTVRYKVMKLCTGSV